MQFVGRGSFKELIRLIKSEKYENIFLVTGKNSFDNNKKGVQFLEQLKKFNFKRFNDFTVNPKSVDLLVGLNQIKDFNPDVIIGIGGGSPMDIAKLLSIYKGVDDKGELEDLIRKNDTESKRKVPLILVPTTAGSGSEDTHFSVVYIDNKKYSVADLSLLPDYVILDSEFLDEIPSSLAAVTALDAFSQAIESYWAVGSTEISRNYSIIAIDLIVQNYNGLFKKMDINVLNNMQLAANYAGKAINISKTTAAHAISYGITSKYGVPHGHAVALTIGMFIDYNNKNTPELYHDPDKFQDYLERGKLLFKALGINNSQEGVLLIRDMLSMAGLSYKLSELGMTDKSEIESLCDGVNLERLSNNPYSIEKEDLMNILQKVF